MREQRFFVGREFTCGERAKKGEGGGEDLARVAGIPQDQIPQARREEGEYSAGR